MQLILDTEATVELKTKMSLSEEKLEICISNMPGLQNGSITNGDTTNGNIEAVDLKETDNLNNLEQIKNSAAVNTDTDSVIENNVDCVSKNNSEMTVSRNADNEVFEDCTNTDILNGKDSDNIEPFTNLDPIENAHNTNESEDKNSAVNEESVSITPASEPNHEVSSENNVKEHESEILNAAELGSNNIENKFPIVTELNHEVSPENNVNEDVSEIVNTEELGSNNTDLSPVSESKIDNVANTIANEVTDIKKETHVDEIAVNSITETKESDEVDVKNETEEMNRKECTIKQEQADESVQNIEANENHLKSTNLEPVGETPVCDGKNNMEMDVSETDIDLIRLDFNPDSCVKPNASNIHETSEKEKSNPSVCVEEEQQIPDDDTVMDVDTSIDHVKETESKEIDLKSPTAETTHSKDQKECELIERNTTTEGKISDLNSSDDIVVDVDDDKEKPAKSPPSLRQTIDDDDKPIDCDDDAEIIDNVEKPVNENINSFEEVIDLDENIPKETEDLINNAENKKQQIDTNEKSIEEPKPIEPILKLSNTLDILSDDEEEQEPKNLNTDNKCINIEDDDDVMLIDDDTSVVENKSEPTKEQEMEKHSEVNTECKNECVETSNDIKNTDQTENVPEKDLHIPEKKMTESVITAPDISEKQEEKPLQVENKKPLIPKNFLKTCKKNMVDMTREELEEFCILKIVESILDRSNLSEIKNKLKMLTQNIEDYKKKAMTLQKQNRDLQVVLKSVQEDVKKYNASPIVPLKITRSVGMQVLMNDKPEKRKRSGNSGPNPNTNKVVRNPPVQTPRPQKPPSVPQIPVPRLVPANNPGIKSPIAQPVNAVKVTSPLPNGVNKTVSPAQKAEKRVHNRMQSVTVDLTDDEPPTKVVNRAPGPVPPVRLVPSQNLLAPPRTPGVNSPRKVYIPISGPQGQVRPGQTIMVKTVPAQNPRQRLTPPHMVRMPRSMQMPRPQGMRHPAPLPECMKQYQPPNWKNLPPAPDLKLAKVENGIVISWKIEGYQEDSYEEIASYQLYAYQETTSPPNTALWKKIGDVKALPLPMACTLTQFMAGYKYYFAVRAVDIRSRLGPFSLPGSILLLNKA